MTAIAELEGQDIDEDEFACPICMEDTRISQEAITGAILSFAVHPDTSD